MLSLELSDPDLIAEARAYSRDDFMDRDEDPRLATRHFDLLIGCAIAWQMKDFAEVAEADSYEQPEYEPSSEFETKGEKGEGNKVALKFAGFEPEPYQQPPYESSSEFEQN